MTQTAAQTTEPFRPPRNGHRLRHLQGGGPVTGQLFLEVLPPGEPGGMPGFDLTLWPQARLGDVTLEAQAVHLAPPPDLVADLLAALRDAGYTPLGPVRIQAPPPASVRLDALSAVTRRSLASGTGFSAAFK